METLWQMLPALIVLAILWVMLFDSIRIRVVTERFYDNRIKAPLRAVVLADLHCKRFGRGNAHLLQLIEDQKPDVIFIAGDMITATPGYKMDAAFELLERLKDRYPIYYGVGNHEHRIDLYPDTYQKMAEEFHSRLDALGIEEMNNTRRVLPEYGISIRGLRIDKFYYKRFGIQKMPGDYVESLVGAPDPDLYEILLAHNPDYFPRYAAWGADLVLAGHVHGGIARVPFPMPPRNRSLEEVLGSGDAPKKTSGMKEKKLRITGAASPNIRLFPEYDGGRFSLDRHEMVVSRGLGVHTIPVRFCNPAELVVLELNPEQE